MLKNCELPFKDFWNERLAKLREINQHLIAKYDIMLSEKSNKRQTVHSLNLKVGDLIWIRIFKFSERLKYMKHLLPKWKLAKIVKINGMASLLCRDMETQQLISRHLQDCAPVKQTGNFSNLYTDTISGRSHEVEEDFGGLEPDQVPNLDGTAIDAELSKTKVSKTNGQSIENPEKVETKTAKNDETWKGRLRSRKTKV